MAQAHSKSDCTMKVWIAAVIVGVLIMIAMLIGGSSWLASMFVGLVGGVLLGLILTWLVCRPAERERSAMPTEPVPAEDLTKPSEPPTPIAEAKPAAAVKPEASPSAPMAAAPEPIPAPPAEPEPEVAKTVEAPVAEGGVKPAGLSGPRGGAADDLKKIKGVGPKLEILLNELGFYHFDQVANWTADEVAWVDQNLKGFKGRVTRDNWVEQATLLASGGETEFSKRVDGGDVY